MEFSPEVVERCQFTIGDYIDNTYRVEGSLGEGSFGKVFRVKDKKGETYALKLLKLWEVEAGSRPDLLKRFDREYETGQIKSDYLVHSICKGKVNGNAYIVMEYCKGGNLWDAIRERKLDLALLGHHILFGLRDLHKNGKVHRDLKPENVLLRNNNHAVLTDFGISGEQNNRLTRRGWAGVPRQKFGTIAYMPPEQMNPPSGNATVLPTTDIFSFGVMMYQLLTDSLPFGKLEDVSDVPQYVTNGKNGNWDRSRLGKLAQGSLWLPLIEGCLLPDYKTRLQTIDDVMAHMPKVNGLRQPDDSKVVIKNDTKNGLLLRVMQGEQPGKIYILNDLFTPGSSILYIGRNSQDVRNHLGIEETESNYISRQHCTLEKDVQNNVWILRDGQYRTRCKTGLTQKYVFPCLHCSENCHQNEPGMRWKDSLNGTYVNSKNVARNGVSIKPGDIISMGDVKMRVEGV